MRIVGRRSAESFAGRGPAARLQAGNAHFRSAAWAAASRAIGTRKGEHDT